MSLDFCTHEEDINDGWDTQETHTPWNSKYFASSKRPIWLKRGGDDQRDGSAWHEKLLARAAAPSFQTLTGLLGYTLDRCVFSFATVQFKKQLIVWSLYFWFGALMMRVTGISIPFWSMVPPSWTESRGAAQMSRGGNCRRDWYRDGSK